ncbi:phosphotransferase family protein [Rhodovulum sp. DZ06]|uniref:phosphotransferase family protein n=1 Tax=Rhodovulum sp. DZ06 TaxID=3425126 RepID=UPI003D3491D9
MSNAAATLDEAVLGPYLEAHVAGFKGLQGYEKFSGGQSNPTFRLKAESGDYVLRAKPPGKLLKSAHMVDREFRVMSALAGTAVPVPKMLHLSEEGEDSPIGRQFYLMEHLDGRVFWDPRVQELSPEDQAAVYDSLNETLAALHDVDIKAAGLEDYGKPGSYFARQLNRWTKQYRASETEPIPEMDRLIAWLENNEPEDDGQVSLVHGDYRLDNVMMHKTEPRALAVLDWELSTLGHPYADLGYQCMNWRLPYSASFRGLGGVPREGTGLPVEEAYVAKYCERRGIDGIPNWAFYLAFSVFRFAAIIQGVYKRALDGNASQPEKAMTYGKAVPQMARLGCDLIDKEA